MNLLTVLEHAGPELDAIGKRLGVGAREDVACRLLLEGIARELGDRPAPGSDGRFKVLHEARKR